MKTTIKNILAEIVLFTIYITMRVVHCLSFWHPFPRYSDWKVCTNPNYQVKHMKEFAWILVALFIALIFNVFFAFWLSAIFGIVSVELGLVLIGGISMLIRKFNKKAPN